jgi:hypothetical protein
MVERPSWLHKKYPGTSLPDSFSGDIDSWKKTLHWIAWISMDHVENGTDGYATIRLWMLAVGLLFRDIGIMKAQPNPLPDIQLRIKYWKLNIEGPVLRALQRTLKMLQEVHASRQARSERSATPFSSPTTSPPAEDVQDIGSSSLDENNMLFLTMEQFTSDYVPSDLTSDDETDMTRLRKIEILCVTQGLMNLHDALAQYTVLF